MEREELEQIALKEKETRIRMNDVPKKTKELFVELAELNFSDNYGQCLKWCLEQALEYQDMKGTFFENIDMKLNLIIGQSQQSPKESPSENYTERTMMDGKTVKRFRKKEVKRS